MNNTFESYIYENESELYCIIDNNPKTSGYRKILFPDRKQDTSKLTIGPAIVTITEDHQNYGYFVGSMKQYKVPNKKRLIRFIKSLNLFDEDIKLYSGPRGSIIMIKNHCLADGDDIKISVDFNIEKDWKLINTISVKDFINAA